MDKGTIYNPWTVIGELAAIWMTDRPLITGDLKRNCRIAPGEKVRLQEGKLVNCSAEEPANHEVIGCYGTTSNSILMLHLRNLKSGTCILYEVVRVTQMQEA